MRRTLISIVMMFMASFGIGLVPLALAQSNMKTMKPTSKTMKPMGKMDSMKPKGGMMAETGPTVPPVAGYADGQKILFIHTETSDPKIAKILTDMMGGSPVLVVPSLAKAPREMLARVYVFTNGMTGDGPMGPLGGQADVFEHPPGGPGYRPLRAVTLVTWKNETSARVLKSVAEVQVAITNGAVDIKEPGIVVNMPFLTWPGGKR